MPGSQSLSDSRDCPRIRILELKGLRSLVQFTIAQMGKMSPEARPPDTTTPACGPAHNRPHVQARQPPSAPVPGVPFFQMGASEPNTGWGRGSLWQQRRQPVVFKPRSSGATRTCVIPWHCSSQLGGPTWCLWPSCTHSVVWWEDWAALRGKGDIRHCPPPWAPNLSQLLVRLTRRFPPHGGHLQGGGLRPDEGRGCGS